MDRIDLNTIRVNLDAILMMVRECDEHPGAFIERDFSYHASIIHDVVDTHDPHIPRPLTPRPLPARVH